MYSEALVEPIAQVFSNLGVKKGYVFYGMDGMDEVTLTTTTKVCEIDNGKFNTFILNPEDYGLLNFVHLRTLQAVTAKRMLKITKEILSGEIKDAKRDIVVLNAALGLCTGGKAESIQERHKACKRNSSTAARLMQRLKNLQRLPTNKGDTMILETIADANRVRYEEIEKASSA